MPPERAIAMPISLSVTVSIAAEMRGTFSEMPRVNRELVSTSLGCVTEWRGTRRTSSNVSAASARMRSAPRGPSMRDGPLAGGTGEAGRDGGRVVVAIAKSIRRPGQSKAALPSPDRSQAAPHAPRQEECRGQQNAAQIRRAQVGQASHPVIADDPPSGVRDEPLQREHQKEHIVHFTEEGNEVGQEIHRRHDVHDRRRDEQLVDAGNALVSEQTAEKPEICGNLLDDVDERALRAGAWPHHLGLHHLGLFHARALSRAPARALLSRRNFSLAAHCDDPPESVIGGSAGGGVCCPSLPPAGCPGARAPLRGAGREAALTTSDATDLPAAATPERTPIARLMMLMVWAMVSAESRPARIVSSSPSVNR